MALPSYDELVSTGEKPEFPSYDELVPKPSTDPIADENVRRTQAGQPLLPPEGSPEYLASHPVIPAPASAAMNENVFDAYKTGGIEGAFLAPHKASDLLKALSGKELPEATSTPEKIAKVLATSPVALADFLISPEGLATVATGGTGTVARAALAGGFGLTSATQAIEAARKGDVEGATSGALIALLSTLGLKGEFKGAPLENALREAQKAGELKSRNDVAAIVREQTKQPTISPKTEGAGEAVSSTTPPSAASPIEVPAQETKALPELKSTEEAISYGQTPEANSEALRAEHQRLLKQAETETGDTKVATITKASLYREAAETAEANPQETTGVANRILTEEAKAGKIDEIAAGEGMTWKEMVDLGREKLNQGADPLEIARRFQRNKRISPTDFAVLRAERERLAIESNKAAQAVRDNPNNAAAKQALTDARKAETSWIRDVVQPAKTSTSDIFRGMQGEAPIDATTFEGLRRAVVDIKGKEPNVVEASNLERRVSKVKKAQEVEARATEQLGKEIDRQLPKTRVPTLDELRSEMERMTQELAPCK